MLLLEGGSHADVYYVLNRARDILHRERWARRYGWVRLDTVLESDEGPVQPFTPGVGYVGGNVMNRLFDDAMSDYPHSLAERVHSYRLSARELNSRGAVVLRVGDPDVAESRAGYDHVRTVGWVHPAGGDVDAQLKEALRCWGAHLDRATSVRAFARGGWGSIWPKVLFVGERHHGADPLARPFGEDGASSAYLSQLLDSAGVAEADAHFINAHSATHGDLSWEAVAWLAPRFVVALGEDASKRLRHLNVRHTRMPHPQYIGRLTAEAQESWVSWLKAATHPELRPCQNLTGAVL